MTEAQPFERVTFDLHNISPLTPDHITPGVEFEGIGRLLEFNQVEEAACGAIKRRASVPYNPETGPLDGDHQIARNRISNTLSNVGAGYSVIRGGRTLVLPFDGSQPDMWNTTMAAKLRSGEIPSNAIGFRVLYLCEVWARSKCAGLLLQQVQYVLRSKLEIGNSRGRQYGDGCVWRGFARPKQSTDIEAAVSDLIDESQRNAIELEGKRVQRPFSGGAPESGRGS